MPCQASGPQLVSRSSVDDAASCLQLRASPFFSPAARQVPRHRLLSARQLLSAPLIQSVVAASHAAAVN